MRRHTHASRHQLPNNGRSSSILVESISDEQWIAACAKILRDDSSEQFLVNLPFVLRETFGTHEEFAADE